MTGIRNIRAKWIALHVVVCQRMRTGPALTRLNSQYPQVPRFLWRAQFTWETSEAQVIHILSVNSRGMKLGGGPGYR